MQAVSRRCFEKMAQQIRKYWDNCTRHRQGGWFSALLSQIPLFLPPGGRALAPGLIEAQGALIQTHGERRGLRIGWTQAHTAEGVQRAGGLRGAGGREETRTSA